MSIALPPCPACESTHVVKNGKIHNGKQNFKCCKCGRQFVQEPQNKVIDEATKTLVDKLWLEKIPLAGIARVADVSEPYSVGKDSGKTSYIERFNCTMRQRVSGLVRKTLSFSKKLENHIGAIWYFVHHYTASLSV